ncbi:MAG: hypothetical protein Q9160_008378 [Pyrenula sp. 1 TL-2023]
MDDSTFAADGFQKTLSLVAEKLLPSKCKPDTLCYCPTMDLIALATEDESVHVFRFKNQRVFGADFGGANLAVKKLAWKEDGQMLAIALSDLSLRLLSSFTGKTVHVFSPMPGGTKSVSLGDLSWKSYFTAPSRTSDLLENANQASPDNFGLEDLLSTTAQAPDLAKYAKTDLPRALSTLDIETSLLKLSTLPATGGDDDVFSSRSSLDAMFHTMQQMPVSGLPNDSVDVLASYSDNGTLHFKIFDCFEIGDISIPPIFTADSFGRSQDVPTKAAIVSQASHSLSSTSVLVAQNQQSEASGSLRSIIMPLTLQFLHNTVPYLSLVAQKCTNLTNILRYLSQVRQQIESEWRTAQDLPSRFIRNIEEDLANQEGEAAMSFKIAAYHLVMTGDCPSVMKEWLLDQVGDRGIKRWEKTMVTGYETLRRLIHECLIPAVERAQVIVSRLFGLASYVPAAQALGLNVQRIERVRDMLDCVNLLGEKLLLRVGKEHRAFEKFIRWLKLEVEIQSAEEGGQTWQELCEGRDSIDIVGVLGFISGTIGERNICDFIDERKRPDEIETWSPLDAKAPFYEKYKALIRPDAGTQDAPKLHELMGYLASLCDKVFCHIGETLRKNIICGKPLEITNTLEGSKVLDLRLVAGESRLFHIYFAGAKICGKPSEPSESDELYLLQADIAASGNIEIVATSRFGIPGISDIRFVDDKSLLVLSSTPQNSNLVELRYRESDAQPYIRHEFGTQDLQRRPMKMAVNGRKGRRAVVVLEQDGMRYTVFDIDSGAPDEANNNENGEAEEGEQDEDMEMVG